MRATLIISAILAVGGAAFIPAQASARNDIAWLSCQLYDSVNNKVVHPNSTFSTAAGVNADNMYDKFLAQATRMGKIDATSKTEGTCVISDSVEEADRKTEQFVQHFKALGAKESWVTFVGF